MKLIGNYFSPFCRRIGVTLGACGIPFELEDVFIFLKPEPVRAVNPLGRIPVLVLDDGEVLVETGAILDAIDEMAGPERRLTPASGPERRRVLKVAAIAQGAAEKAQAAMYEIRFHAPEKVEPDWIARCEEQSLAGFRWLDGVAEAAEDEGWLTDTSSLGAADVAAVCAFTYAATVRPDLGLAAAAPALARFAARCETLPLFSAAPVPPPWY